MSNLWTICLILLAYSYVQTCTATNNEESPELMVGNINGYNYYRAFDVDEDILENVNRKKSDGIWSSIVSYFRNSFKRPYLNNDKDVMPEGSDNIEIIATNETQLEPTTEEIKQLFDSLSTMWKQTVDKQVNNLKAFSNETLQRIPYEKAIESMKNLQNELSSLWSGTHVFVTHDNKTLTANDLIEFINDNNGSNWWQSWKEKFNSANDKMQDIWDQIDDQFKKINVTKIFNSVKFQDLREGVLQMQEKLNDGWQRISNRIEQITQNNTECEDCNVGEKVFSYSVDRMNRIQGDVKQLWQSLKEKFDNSNDENFYRSTEKRVKDIWENAKNYYNKNVNSSRIEDLWHSAQDGVTKVGDFFKDVWQRGSDAINKAQKNTEEHRERLNSLINNLNNRLKSLIDRINDGVEDAKELPDDIRYAIEREA